MLGLGFIGDHGLCTAAHRQRRSPLHHTGSHECEGWEPRQSLGLTRIPPAPAHRLGTVLCSAAWAVAQIDPTADLLLRLQVQLQTAPKQLQTRQLLRPGCCCDGP